MNKRQKKKREKLLSSYESWDGIHISWKQKREQEKVMKSLNDYMKCHKYQEPKPIYLKF